MHLQDILRILTPPVFSLKRYYYMPGITQSDLGTDYFVINSANHSLFNVIVSEKSLTFCHRTKQSYLIKEHPH